MGKRVGRMETIPGGRGRKAWVVFEEQIKSIWRHPVLSCAGFLNFSIDIWAALCFVAGQPCVVWDA